MQIPELYSPTKTLIVDEIQGNPAANPISATKLCTAPCHKCIHFHTLPTNGACNHEFYPIKDAPDPIQESEPERKKPRFCKKCNNTGFYFRNNGKSISCEKCKGY